MRSPQIEFGFPLDALPSQFHFEENSGFYWNKTILVFTDEEGSDIEGSLNHEYLHYVIDRLAGKRASKKFDKICKRFKELR